MIAQRDDIGSGLQDLIRLLRSDSHHIGVFSVDHTETDVIFLLEIFQTFP